MEYTVTIVGFILIAFAVLAKNRLVWSYTHPLVVMLFFAGVVMVTYYNCGLNYSFEPSAKTWILYLTTLTFTAISVAVGHFSTRPAHLSEAKKLPIIQIRIIAYAFAIIGAISTLAQLLIYRNYIISFDFDGLRNAVYTGEAGGSILARLSRFGGFAIISAGIALQNIRSLRKYEGLAIIVFCSLTIFGLALGTAGRWPLILLVIAIMVTAHVPKILNVSLLKVVLPVGVLLIAYIFILPHIRSRQNSGDVIENFEKIHNMQLNQTVGTILYALPRGFDSIYLNLTTYFTQGPTYLFLYHESENQNSGGILHFSLIARLLGIISWADLTVASTDLRLHLYQAGSFTEIWATGIRESIHDFGFYGSYLFWCATGFLCGVFSNSRAHYVSHSVMYFPLSMMIYILPITSLAESPVFSNTFNAVLVLAIFILFFDLKRNFLK